MSIQQALEKIKEKYNEYHQKLMFSDPCVADQLKDAELRGMVMGLDMAVKALEADE